MKTLKGQLVASSGAWWPAAGRHVLGDAGIPTSGHGHGLGIKSVVAIFTKARKTIFQTKVDRKVDILASATPVIPLLATLFAGSVSAGRAVTLPFAS